MLRQSHAGRRDGCSHASSATVRLRDQRVSASRCLDIFTVNPKHFNLSLSLLIVSTTTSTNILGNKSELPHFNFTPPPIILAFNSSTNFVSQAQLNLLGQGQNAHTMHANRNTVSRTGCLHNLNEMLKSPLARGTSRLGFARKLWTRLVVGVWRMMMIAFIITVREIM